VIDPYVRLGIIGTHLRRGDPESALAAIRNVVETAKLEERERIIALLDGIDKDECEYRHGWWETDRGAAFGASILRQIKEGS
jgi:hypothetical protein